jgi:uracil-DNA glycosylase
MIQIEESWYNQLEKEFEKQYFKEIKEYLQGQKKIKTIIYPPGPLIFNAFASTPFDKVKVVILGQDPYHQPNQAMGLSFSVPKGIRVPPSLKNIYKELNRDFGNEIPTHGDLTTWANQGVLLLNTILTVEANNAASHSKIGWQNFTDAVISTLSQKRDGLIFMLWGNHAKLKKELIDSSKHLILESAHPSPLAGNAFQGCGHFSKANLYLQKNGQSQIDWKIDS